MASQTATGRIRLGILTLPIGAALILAGTVIGGSEAANLTGDVGDYAEFAVSTRAAISNFLSAIGQLLLIFGFFALYACMAGGRAERWAFFAMILCVPSVAVGFASTAGTSVVEAIAAEQYLEGQRAVFEEWYDLFDWTSILRNVFQGALFPIGVVLFGVAIWRSRALPQGAAILWFAYLLFFFAIPLTPWANVFSWLLVTVASGWIAWTVWRQPSSEVAGAGAQGRVR